MNLIEATAMETFVHDFYLHVGGFRLWPPSAATFAALIGILLIGLFILVVAVRRRNP